VLAGLRGNERLLKLSQQLFRLGQRQTQVGDITKTIRPVDLHHVETSRPTVNLRPNQTQLPFHLQDPNRQHIRPIVSI
jgi:hypothetical protein